MKSTDEKLCLWLEDFDNPELDPFEQDQVFSEQVSIFNTENGTEYKYYSAIKMYEHWRHRKYSGLYEPTE